MPDRYGPRGVFAIIIPLQNANMQPEYEMMRPEGVSNQIFRFTLAQHDKAPDAMVSAIGGALEKYGEGVHLVALAVDNLAEATAEMKANGARIIESGTQVFVHPRDGHGVMYQLIERA